MDPGGMMNEAGLYNLPEIWQFPINGDSSMRGGGVPFGGPFVHSNLNGTTTCGAGDPARTTYALPPHAGVSGGRRRREAVEAEEESAKVVSTSNGNGGSNGGSKRQKTGDEQCESKAEVELSEKGMEQKKHEAEPPRDYIHVRARRGQATDSHSLAERARREKISERMKILQDIVPGCNKVIGKALVLDEIINYIQSLQRQVEFLSMKLEAVNSRMAPSTDLFPPKEFVQQPFENSGLQFNSQTTRDYSRGASPEWLHMQVGGGFERTS